MIIDNGKTILFASLIVAMILPFSMMDKAQAEIEDESEIKSSCWWCTPPKHQQQLHFQLGYQHDCDKGFGKCVTMSGHWQPIQEGTTQNLGFVVLKDYDWIKPITQTKTKEVSVRGIWDIHSTVVDKYKNLVSKDATDKEAMNKQLYFETPATATFNKIIADVDKGTLIFQVITVRSIT